MMKTTCIFVIILFNLIIAKSIIAQIPIQVTHTSGTQIISGTSITVNSSGGAGIWNTYCPSVTAPYAVGYDQNNLISVEGSYMFQFSPPVDSISINISGLGSIYQTDLEEAEININGFHLSLDTVIYNDCDSLAIISLNGNLTHELGKPSGSKDIKVNYPVSSVSISDRILFNNPYGFIFSLFFYESGNTFITENVINQLIIEPNPAKNQVTVINQMGQIKNIQLYDLTGNEIFVQFKTDYNSSLIDLEKLTNGIYIIQVTDEKGIYKSKLVIEK
jgi:hypothetical protein